MVNTIKSFFKIAEYSSHVVSIIQSCQYLIKQSVNSIISRESSPESKLLLDQYIIVDQMLLFTCK
jgi:hypothetical protein